MTTHSTLRDLYQAAAEAGQLSDDQKVWLIRHAQQRAEALASVGQDALDPAIVSIAAVLMTSNERLSSLTALSQAEKLALVPGLGQALLDVQKGLNYLATHDITQQIALDSMSRNAVIYVLQGMLGTVTHTLRSLGVPAHSPLRSTTLADQAQKETI